MNQPWPLVAWARSIAHKARRLLARPTIDRKAPHDPRWEPFLDACALGAPSTALRDGIGAGFHLRPWSDRAERDELGPLHLAATASDPFALRALLRAGSPVDDRNWRGTALDAAARLDATQAMEILLDAGARNQPDPHQWSALATAGHSGSLGALSLLTERLGLRARRASDSRMVSQALNAAARGPTGPTRLACVQWMVDLGADPNWADAHGIPALFAACDAGDRPTVEALLEAGANPLALRSHDNTDVFMLACRNWARDPEVPRLVASRGGAQLRHRDDGRSTLMFAAHGGMPECVQMALAAGGDPRGQDAKGETALHFAALSGSLACVEMLLDRGADPNAICSRDWTPLARAAQTTSLDIFSALVAKGGDPTLCPTRENSPFAQACAHGWSDPLVRAWVLGMGHHAQDSEAEEWVVLAESIDARVGGQLRAAHLARVERELLAAGHGEPVRDAKSRRL